MRKLLLIPLLALMSGCVTYYYPGLESSGGVYYADDEPGYTGDAYSDNAYSDYSGYAVDYSGIHYYPWWSLDYLYLGSGHYRSGFSIGFGTRYPSYYPRYSYWYDPFYYPSRFHDPWYYSTWYSPVIYHNSYYSFGHRNAYWHNRYRDYHHGYHPNRNRHGERHVRRDRYGDNDDLARNRDRDDRRNPDPGRNQPGDYSGDAPGRANRPDAGAMSRRVAVAPSAQAGDRGMVVRSRDEVKQKRSRIEPVIKPSPAVKVAAGTPGENRRVSQRSPGYVTTRGDSGQVRSRPEPKQRPSRTEPVTRQKQAPSVSYRAGPIPRNSSSSQPPVQSRRDTMTVRSGGASKSHQSRTEPVAPAVSRQNRPSAVVRSSPSRSVSPSRSTAPRVRSTPPQRPAPRAAPSRNSAPVARSPKTSSPRATRSSPRPSAKIDKRDQRRD